MARRQGELFPEPIVAIHPDPTRGEPRLWVRRLVIWEDPEKLIRDIRLRRGLNVIWSPDPGTATATVGGGDGSGHGAGKTLFCLSLIHISEPTRQAEISYAVFCLKKKK